MKVLKWKGGLYRLGLGLGFILCALLVSPVQSTKETRGFVDISFASPPKPGEVLNLDIQAVDTRTD